MNTCGSFKTECLSLKTQIRSVLNSYYFIASENILMFYVKNHELSTLLICTAIEFSWLTIFFIIDELCGLCKVSTVKDTFSSTIRVMLCYVIVPLHMYTVLCIELLMIRGRPIIVLADYRHRYLMVVVFFKSDLLIK